MTRIKVVGMSCGHCEQAVQDALSAVAGVNAVLYVDREREEAAVEGAAEMDQLIQCIQSAGYEASPID